MKFATVILAILVVFGCQEEPQQPVNTNTVRQELEVIQKEDPVRHFRGVLMDIGREVEQANPSLECTVDDIWPTEHRTDGIKARGILACQMINDLGNYKESVSIIKFDVGYTSENTYSMLDRTIDVNIRRKR